jgi:endonuclease/exonuclease/phosphatase family metal-dependent hydrolase
MLAILSNKLDYLLSHLTFPCIYRPFLRWVLTLFCILYANQGVKAQGADTIKVVSYNLLHYPDISSGAAGAADTANRHPHYRNIISAMNPDILVVEEVQSTAGFTWFLNSVMNANQNLYGAATFVNGPDMDGGLYFKTSKFQFIATKTIVTDLRNIYEYTLKHLFSNDTLRVYAVHLKASFGTVEEQQRLREVDSLRKVTNTLPLGSNFIVCGDFNIYGAQEPAYAKLLQVQAGVEGHFFDLINLSGTWNNSLYAVHHTQSTRTRSFGGGSTGGMDDRFDMILYSKAISEPGGWEVVPNSLIPFGNDGNHYNDSINSQPNSAVSAAIANALHQASDHIPITMKLVYQGSAQASIDVGVHSLVTNGAYCPTTNGEIKVKIRNYSASTINFANNNVTVNATIVNPLSTSQNISITLSAGQINAGQDTILTLSNSYAMTAAGSYSVSAFTNLMNDVNISNNAMPASNFTVLNDVPAMISPAGPIEICAGNSVTLTANSGASYLWSTGSTSNSILVNAPGNYQVTVTSSGGCASQSNIVVVSLVTGASTVVLFSESMGTVTSTTSIASHENANGFQNTGFTMLGTADVRLTQTSLGYSGASGGANVFFTNTAGRYFTISGINTLGLSNVSIDFGMYKSTVASTGSELKVQVSDDGILFADLSVVPISGGSGWYLRTANGAIPQSNNLRLRFYQTSGTVQFRVDDIVFKYQPSSTITAADTIVCSGDSVLLMASSGNNYLWSTGETTQSILINTAGDYSVFVDCIESPVKTIYNCNNPTQLHVKFFIEGFYAGANQMIPRLFYAGISSNPTDCDSVLIEWRNTNAPFSLVTSVQAVMNIDGDIFINLPPALINQSYYLIIKHSNSIETWSKFPVFMNGNPIIISLTGP